MRRRCGAGARASNLRPGRWQHTIHSPHDGQQTIPESENGEDALPIAHSILSGEGMARLVREHYGFGPGSDCHLLRSGYNEVYALDAVDGSRRIARLGALRVRGAANVDYEVSMLEHVAARGALVAEPVRPLSGSAGVVVSMPEGPRHLTLFHRVEGELPDTPDDIAFTGEGLATLHEAAEGYVGPTSRYRYDVDHLLRAPLSWILRVPTMDVALRKRFEASALAIESDLAACGPLTHVACHGDCHGGNNFVRPTQAGEREAVFFDFDDAAPGPLAYDLAVFLWNLLEGRAAPTEEVSSQWSCYLNGYRRRRELVSADIEAIPLFVRMRHFLWLGERASRSHQWGSEALPYGMLVKQPDLFESWRSLEMAGLSRERVPDP